MGVKIRYRFLVSFVTWLSITMFYILRGNMSVTIIAMNIIRLNASNKKVECPVNELKVSHIKENGPFRWDAVQQGTVLSAFFYGYMAAHILGSVISTLIGPRYCLTICIIGATIFTFLVVPMSYAGYEACVVARFLIGFFSGPVYPIAHEMIGRWAPFEERTVYAIITHTGNIIGLIINFSVGAYLCNYNVDGWIYFIYFSGALGIFNLILWLLLGFDHPWTHPFISDEEKDYIIKSLYPQGIPDETNAIKKIPFKNLFSSKNVWLASVAHFTYCFLLYMYLTGFAKYLSDVYGLDVETSSYLSIIPFVTNFVFQIIVSFSTNYVVAKKLRSVTFVRKLVTLIAVLGSCPLLFPVGFLNCDQMVGCIIMLSISCGFVGLLPCGYFIGMIDLAPKYAGYILAIDNTIGSIAGIINPQIAGVFIAQYGTKDGWKYLFILTAVVSIILAGIWIIWGTCERRPWADYHVKFQAKKDEESTAHIVDSSKSELEIKKE